MSFILDTLIPLVLVYKYWALLLICFTASFALPLPATTSITAMAAFAGSGYVDIWGVAAAAFVGFVIGDCFGFLLAKFYGPSILKFRGLKRISHYRYYKEAESYVRNHQTITIFLSRFVTAAGPVVNILAGLSGLSFKKFLLIDLIGEGFDVALFCLSGYFFGDQFQNYGSNFSLAGLIIVIVIILGYKIFSYQKKKRKD